MPIGVSGRLREYLFEVGLGNVEGHRRFAGLGNNTDVDQATVPEHAWPGGGLYPWIGAAGVSLEVVSASAQDSATGTGISTILLTTLDIDYVETTHTIQLTGTTAVAVPGGPWLRINDGRGLTKGSGAAATRVTNAGDITIRDSGGGTARAILPAGRNFLRQAIYTIPAGYTGEVLSMYIGFNRGTGVGATRYLTVSTYSQNPSGVYLLPLDLSCDGESYRHDGLPGIFLPQKTDFAMEIVAVSADNSDVTCAFLGVMKQNSIAI
jgi:hypothetical protein